MQWRARRAPEPAGTGPAAAITLRPGVAERRASGVRFVEGVEAGRGNGSSNAHPRRTSAGAAAEWSAAANPHPAPRHGNRKIPRSHPCPGRRQAAGRRPKTIQSYRWHLNVFRSWVEEEGLTDISAITIEDMERFVVFLRNRDTLYTSHPKRGEEKKALSAATIYGTVRALKTFFKFLAQRGYLASDPAAGLVMPEKPKKLPPTIPLKAIEAMLAAARRGPCPRRDRAIMLLLLDTGPRVSELCRLDIEDLDLEEGKMILHGKGGKDRIVSITPHIISALAELLDGRPRQGPVFVIRSASAKRYGISMG